MLQITKNLQTELFIPVDYINETAGNLSRDTMAWDGGDNVLITLVSGKTALGYNATTSDKGVKFTLNGNEGEGVYKVVLTLDRGARAFSCVVDYLIITDKVTTARDTFSGVYFYAQNSVLQFAQAYTDGDTPATVGDINALREQIARNGGGGGADLSVNVTYAELKALRDNGQLVAGQSYRITDYTTTTTQEDTLAAGRDFDVIVTALDANTLSEDAHAIKHNGGDGVFKGENLSAWLLRYCLDNDTTRFAWADGGTPARWCVVVDGDTWEYVRVPKMDSGGLFAWAYDDEGLLDLDDIMYTQSATPYVGDIATQDGEEYEITSVTPRQEGNGKGVIYYMRDEFGNECPYDFKNIIFDFDGVQYYTFNGSDDFTSKIENSKNCKDNTIKPLKNKGDGVQHLNAVILKGTAEHCEIGFNCSNCEIGGMQCEGVIIGNNCENVVFDNIAYCRDIKVDTGNITVECADTTDPFNYAENIVILHSANQGGFKTVTIPHAGNGYITTFASAGDKTINT